jgi:hypothetical protein
MSTPSSAFLLCVRETAPDTYEAMSDQERRRCLDRWDAWVDSMAADGRPRDGHPPEDARRVVAELSAWSTA